MLIETADLICNEGLSYEKASARLSGREREATRDAMMPSAQRVVQPYDHDCDACVWVGWYSGAGLNRLANIYLCQGKTIVIRYSSEGSDYWSSTTGMGEKGPVRIA